MGESVQINISGKKILLAVTGSIALYKSAEWLRNLQKAGADITVLMTTSAKKFVTPLTFEALSGNRVFSDMFDDKHPETIPHIALGQGYDLILVAPATAQTISRLANGMADDLLSAVILAADCPIMLCPAMNSKMYIHPATQINIEKLTTFGYEIIKPDSGEMACGDIGPGRLPEWHIVYDRILHQFSSKDLLGQIVLISAGPTEEPLDPVRFISNRSTGKMGYALAWAAKLRGAEVILISGPTTLTPPSGITTFNVRTAMEMAQEFDKQFKKATIIIKAAAVSDFRPSKYYPDKIKKDTITHLLELTANPDILKSLGAKIKKNGSGPILVGFAAESSHHLEEGLRKLLEKHLDMIVINDIISKNSGFAADTNQVTIITKDRDKQVLPLLSKNETATAILDNIMELPNFT